MLKDNLCQQAIGQYAGEIGKTYLLMCWTEIEEYKALEVLPMRKTKAEGIFNKYLDSASDMKLEDFTEDQLEGFRASLRHVRDEQEGDNNSLANCFAEVV